MSKNDYNQNSQNDKQQDKTNNQNNQNSQKNSSKNSILLLIHIAPILTEGNSVWAHRVYCIPKYLK